MKPIHWIFIFNLVPTCGCGTLMEHGTISGQRRTFGGVQYDVERVTYAEREQEEYQRWPIVPEPKFTERLLCAADLPFSAIADILLLPFTISHALEPRSYSETTSAPITPKEPPPQFDKLLEPSPPTSPPHDTHE